MDDVVNKTTLLDIEKDQPFKILDKTEYQELTVSK